MIAIEAFYARQGIVNTTAVVFAVERVAKHYAQSISVFVQAYAFSDNAGNVGLCNVFALEGNDDAVFCLVQTIGFNRHAIAVYVKAIHFDGRAEPFLEAGGFERYPKVWRLVASLDASLGPINDLYVGHQYRF